MGRDRPPDRPYDALPARELLLHGGERSGKARMFTPYAGGVGTYRRVCDAVVANGYEGFRMSAAAGAASA